MKPGMDGACHELSVGRKFTTTAHDSAGRHDSVIVSRTRLSRRSGLQDASAESLANRRGDAGGRFVGWQVRLARELHYRRFKGRCGSHDLDEAVGAPVELRAFGDVAKATRDSVPFLHQEQRQEKGELPRFSTTVDPVSGAP